jgi:hypothetical protein
MIAQAVFTILLLVVVLYAWNAYRRSPLVGLLSLGAALSGLYFVWLPAHATQLAALAGIGRGVDLILYTWVAISLIVVVNLHLKLRAQMDCITALARNLAITQARTQTALAGKNSVEPTSARLDGGEISPLPPSR